MSRFVLVVATLSISWMLSQNAWAQRPPRGRHVDLRRGMPAQAAAVNQARQAAAAAKAGRQDDDDRFAFQNFGFGGGAFGAPGFGRAFGYGPMYRPSYGYAPVYGFVPVYGFGLNGFTGAYGGGGYSTTFYGSNFGGQDYFSSPAYGHWGAFGK